MTFVGNYAKASGGATANQYGKLTITNVIFWNNASGTWSSRPMYDESATTTVSDGLMDGDCDKAYKCTNLSDADPLFVDEISYNTNKPSTGDFRLLPGSPALDRGDNTVATDTDIRGYTRTVNGTVDFGAYEAQGFDLAYTSGGDQYAVIGNDFAEQLQVSVSSPVGDPVGPGGQITVTGPANGAVSTPMWSSLPTAAASPTPRSPPTTRWAPMLSPDVGRSARQ
ncbi:MAG: choice-of-anchor Q domain-containing protein [Caldilineaceae bacterium]